MPDDAKPLPPVNLILRHESDAARERSACGHRYRLLSRVTRTSLRGPMRLISMGQAALPQDRDELYYVLEGEGSVMLDGEERAVRKGRW